ncbi:hypothetical protein Pelo_3168 [Pelomyxa schiedti]|nr:hypothetical protein Pelo_3168 [Pelomyxa schiedti]
MAPIHVAPVDPLFFPVMKGLCQGNDNALLAVEPENRWKYIAARDLFVIKEDKLYCLNRPMKHPHQSRILKLCVEIEDDRRTLMTTYHNALNGGGHRGETKMIHALSQKYWWLNLWKDVENWCREFTVCQQFWNYKPSFEPKNIIAHFPVEYVTRDFFFPPVPSNRGHTAVLLMVDLHSRLVRLKALKNREVPTVLRAIEKTWICTQGCPMNLLNDRDKSFISELNAEFYHTWGIMNCKAMVLPKSQFVL